MTSDGAPLADGATPGDGGETPDDGGTTSPRTVEERLAHIGIGLDDLEDVGGSVLSDFDGYPLPSGAHPLRNSIATINGGSEFFVFGAGVGGGAVVDMDRPAYMPSVEEHVVFYPSGGLETFLDPVALSLHADMDGREETLVFDLRPAAGGGAQTLYVFTVEDEEEGFTTTRTGLDDDPLGAWAGATMLTATRRDVEGDGLEEVFLLARVGADWQYRMYAPATGVLGPAVVGGPLAHADLPGDFSDFSLAAGQIDDDPREEVVLLINNRVTGGPLGDTRIVIFDDVAGVDTIIRDHKLTMREGDSIVAAGVALADIDGDFRDEIVVAGTNTDDSSGRYTQLLTVLDDLTPFSPGTPFRRLYQSSFSRGVGGSQTVRIRDTQISVAQVSVSAETPAIPGGPPPSGLNVFDPADDVLVNNVLWEWSTVSLPAATTPIDRANAMARGPREIFTFDSNGELIVSKDTVQFALGQLDSDGIPDAAVLTQESGLFDGNDAGTLRTEPVFGTGTAKSTVLRSDGPLPMQLVPASVDADSMTVLHLSAEHGIRYTEPVILAVLAAPPCYAGPMGQYTNECSTTFGNTSSSESATTSSYGFSLGITVGYGWEERVASQSELKATYTAKASTTFTTGESAEISFSRAYTNGAPEDQVLATVFGLETFVYLILSAPPGPMGESRVGERMTISIPRSEAHTTRLFSESLIRPSLKPSQAAALDAVFDHTPTDPLSYHQRSELSAYMARLGVVGPECNEATSPDSLGDCGYLTSMTAIDPGVVSLPGGISGSGSGAEGSFSITNGTSSSTAWSVEGTIDVETSVAGVIFGVSIGATGAEDMTVSHGSTVEYGFGMGAVDPDVYAPYRAQLFAFRHRFDCDEDSCQSFEVLNFWTGSSTP